MWKIFYPVAFFVSIFLPQGLFCQGMVLPPTYKQHKEPAFEKIYVKSWQLITMPDGLYYYDDEGGSCKIKTVLADYDGMYILVVRKQCPLCGRCSSGFETDSDEWDCPIPKPKIHPRVWVD